MPPIRSMIDPGRPLPARHLTRPGETLETFGARLREAVSSAVGETVAGIVRETVRAVLAEQPTIPSLSERFLQRPRHPPPLWERPDDLQDEPWFDDPDNYPPEEEDVPPSNRTEDTGDPSCLPRAIAVGFHTTLCWLRRRVSRYPGLTAVARGLLTAV